eukprot:652345-Amphidinium_carterae.1
MPGCTGHTARNYKVSYRKGWEAWMRQRSILAKEIYSFCAARSARIPAREKVLGKKKLFLLILFVCLWRTIVPARSTLTSNRNWQTERGAAELTSLQPFVSKQDAPTLALPFEAVVLHTCPLSCQQWWRAMTSPCGTGGQLSQQQGFRLPNSRPGQPASLILHQRAKKYMEAGAPLLKKRDYEGIQDNRTLRDFCVTGKQWLSHETLLALLEPFTAPQSEGAQYWHQGSPVLKYLDWRQIAMGCWGDRRCRISALPLGESICEDLALVGLARKP